MNADDQSTDFTMLREIKEELGIDFGMYMSRKKNDGNINSDIDVQQNIVGT